MDFDVRSIFLLKREEIVQLARMRAEAGQDKSHGFEPGSAHACTFERAYEERRRELDAQGAELV